MKAKKATVRNRPKEISIAAPVKDQEYEKDFFNWTREQAKFLKKGEFAKLDIANLIEEIESLGRSEKRTLISYLEILLMHMLKARYQPSKYTKSWDLSLKEANHKASKTLEGNPSLKPKLKEIVEDAYFSARIKAALETKLSESKFPEKCPWGLKELFPDLEKKYL
jgi:hypothetical protein